MCCRSSRIERLHNHNVKKHSYIYGFAPYVCQKAIKAKKKKKPQQRYYTGQIIDICMSKENDNRAIDQLRVREHLACRIVPDDNKGNRDLSH